MCNGQMLIQTDGAYDISRFIRLRFRPPAHPGVHQDCLLTRPPPGAPGFVRRFIQVFGQEFAHFPDCVKYSSQFSIGIPQD